MLRRLSFISLLTLLMFALHARAFAGVLTAEVDKTVGTIDDQFDFTVTVSGKAEGEPKFPQVDGLDVVSQGTSTSVQMGWGKYDKQVTYTFTLVPTKSGKITIPAIQLKIDDEIQATSPITLTVNEAGGAASSPGTAADATPPVFIERELSSNEIYEGEAVVSTVRFYTRLQIANASVRDNTPNTIKRVPLKGEKTYRKDVKGQTYEVTELKEVLIPQTSGVIKVEGYQIIAETVTNNGSRRSRGGSSMLEQMFGGAFMQGNVVPRRVTAPPVSITVKPLPTEGQPKNFSGIVGDFALKSDLSSRSIQAGDTLTLTLTLEGNGSVEGLASPQLDLANKMKIYPDQPSLDDQYNATNGVNGTAIFKYALVPLVNGAVNLGTISVPIFNPRTKKYETKTADLGIVEVTGEITAATSAVTPAQTSSSTASPVAQTNSDLIEPKSGAALYAQDALSPTDHWIVAALVLVPGIVWLALYIVMGARRRSRADVAGTKRHVLQKQLKTKLAEFGEHAPTDEATLVSLGQLYRDYLGTYVGSHGAALTQHEITALMQQRNVPEALRQRIVSTMSTLERPIYSGAKLQAAEWSQLRTQMQSTLQDLRKVRES